MVIFCGRMKKLPPNILADRLSLLEKEGFISKQEHPGNKSKFLYCLTQKGIDLLPVLLEMIVWSERYLEVSESGRALAQRIRSNREALIREITDNLKKAE